MVCKYSGFEFCSANKVLVLCDTHDPGSYPSVGQDYVYVLCICFFYLFNILGQKHTYRYIASVGYPFIETQR